MIADIAKTGDRRAILEALRDKLAEAIDEGPEPKDLAALSLRLEKVTADLDALPTPVPVDQTWETRLAARRAAKQTASG